MKQKIVLAIALISLLLTGCRIKEESTYAHDGKVALENHQYEEAKKLLSSALEENRGDEYSRSMYIQAVKMINVVKYEEIKNYDKAIEELKSIEDMKGGSSAIKSEAANKKKELETLNDELEKAEQKRKEDAKSTAKQDKYKLQQEALELERKKQEALEKKRQEKEEAEKESNENQNIVITPPSESGITSP